VKKAQCGRLDGAAKEKRAFLQSVGQVCHEHLADIVSHRAIQDEAERAFGIVLTDKYDSSLKERTAELAAVQQQLAFKRC
jgi:hypothetical protein